MKTLKKIVIVSDSHHQNDLLKQVVQKEKADLYLHAGDSEATEEEIYPFLSVRGNCDFTPFPLERVITIEEVTLLLVHGHRLTQNELIRKAKDVHASLVICGHSHCYMDVILDGIHIINPGSIAKPRDFFKGYLLLFVDGCNIEVRKISLF